MLMSQLTRRSLPAVLIAAVAWCSGTARAQDSAIEYATLGYQHVDQQCSAIFDALSDWKGATAASRAAIVRSGAAAANRLVALTNPDPVESLVKRVNPPDASTIEAFEKLASGDYNPIGARALLFDIMGRAKAAKPPHMVTDMQDAHLKIADYAGFCTLTGIASLQTSITR